jgi:hypothetical protein
VKALLSLTLALGVSACNSDSFQDILGEVDQVASSDSPAPCTIDSSLPSVASIRVASSATTNTSFGIARSSSACAITWKLNGVSLSGQTEPFTQINSNALNAGVNTLVAEISDGSSSASRSWSVTKNSPPVCNSQTPGVSGNSISHTETLPLSVSVSDADGDQQVFTWKLNGAQAPSLFVAQSSTVNTAAATFDPTISQVGAGQQISVDFNDGYESSSCLWTADVTDPNTVQIGGCFPAGNPVIIKSAGAESSKTFTVSATGTGLNYTWKLNNSPIGGASSAVLSLSAAGLTVGNHTLVALVTDTYNNQASCTFNVKRNSPPQLTVPLPDTAITRRVNVATTQTFAVTGADANGDAISYSWRLNGNTNSALPTGAATSIFNPASNASYLGAHTVNVTASDGQEETSLSWNMEVNFFSDECNTIMNGTVASHGGRICTLVGVPSIGDNEDPEQGNNLRVRITPSYALDDGVGNIYYSDHQNHVVALYNRSSSSLDRHGKTIPAGKIVIVLGNGAAGAVPEGSVGGTEFKLSSPMGLAYDSTDQSLYVADYGNHRVVKLPSSGYPATLLGQRPNVFAPSNNTAGNTNGALGAAHHCSNPVDLAYFNAGGGTRWLYVTCYSSNAIKRINLANNKTYVVVGMPQSGTGQNNTNAAVNCLTDGCTTLTSGANQPWGMDIDASGNIYWVDRGSRRFRMATLSGTAMNLSSMGSLPAFVQLQATGGLITHDLTSLQRWQGGAPNRWLIRGPGGAGQNVCVPYRAVVASGNNTVTRLGSPVTLILSDSGAGAATGQFFSDSNCSVVTAGATLSAGDTGYTFYYRQTLVAASTLSATGTLAAANLVLTPVATPAAADRWQLYLMGASPNVSCQPVLVLMQNAAGQMSSHASAQTATLSATAGAEFDPGAFYSDAACTASTSTVAFAAGERWKVVYYSANSVNAQVPANSVRWIYGSSQAGLVMSNNSTGLGFPEATGTSFNDALGISVYQPGGVVRGLLINSWNQHLVGFVNLHPTSTYSFGGVTIGSGNVSNIIGNGGAGYNGDNVGSLTLVNGVYDVSVSADQSFLMAPEQGNNRIRRMDLTTASAEFTGFIGGGRTRTSYLTDVAVRATEAYLNSPTELLFDSTNKFLYIADSGNGRIRTVNMKSGQFYTVAGKGTGGNPVIDNDEPLNVWMRGVRGMSFASSGAESFLVYADQQATTGASTTSLLRAMNLSQTNGSLLGTNIQAGRVSTVVGDFITGSNFWNGNTNLPSNSAPYGNLYNPYSVVWDGTSFFIANYNDHSIMRANQSTGLTRLIGNGIAGATDGVPGAAVLRNPVSLARDPAYSSDPNFFFVDNIDQSSARIRYSNFTNSPVAMWSLPGQGVPAGTASAPFTRTVQSFSIPAISEMNSSSAWVNSMAAFGNLVCISSGLVSNSVNGTHSVICYDRTDGSIARRIGPNESNNPIRGGAPLGREQEGISASSATMFTPHGLAFDSEGNLYISERNSALIRFVKRWW